MDRRLALWAGIVLIAAGGVLIVRAWPGPGGRPPEPAASAEPLVPTRTSSPRLETGRVTASPSPTAETAVPTITPTETHPPAPSASTNTPTVVPSSLSPSPTQIPDSTEQATLYQGHPRWCVGDSSGSITDYDVEPLRLGWYLDWAAQLAPPRPDGVEYAQMIRLKGGTLTPDAQSIARIAAANPGSLWLVGNEPDVKWQDNVEPPAYARLYHEAYAAIKGADAIARIAIGGVTQPTPLRLQYLEAVLAAYRQAYGSGMPVDVWNVHNFILREERGSWGVDIPPGLGADQGRLYTVDQCDDMEVFRRQILDFRTWMAEHGQQDKPLIVSEYGILMPEDYGFPPERVGRFLTATFDFFRSATDRSVGYAPDSHRLVQRWCWYSLDAPDSYYPTGRLFDPRTRQITAVGQRWAAYVGHVIPEQRE